MKRNIKRIVCALLSVLLVLGMLSACSNDTAVSVPEQTTQPITEETSAAVTEEVTVSDEVIEMAEDTIEAVESEQDISSTELAPVPDDEAEIIDEGAIEPDAQVEQENISYDGTNTGNGLSLLGKCTGLTYYSQADSRWASLPYTSTNNKSQTMKSSACGPTSAAMVVSSSKGAILPTTMAQLFVDNGYRTASNGTAWAAFSFVADYFDFNEYHTTSNFNTMLEYLKKGYFIIVSCGNGLFTTGGHYIVIIDYSNCLMTVFDPYNYPNKYNTASRKAANVTVSGNSAFVTESNFKKYANPKQYWIFSNDNQTQTASTTNSKKSATTSNKSSAKTSAPTFKVGKTYTLTTNVKVRTGAGTNYAQKKKSQLTADGRKHALNQTYAVLKSGTKFTVQQVKKNGSDIWVKIPSGWICVYYYGSKYAK